MSPPVENLVSRFQAKRSGKGWIAFCPAHEDHKPSLSISEGADGRALVNCFAGCSTERVLAALGLTVRDLFQATHPQPSGTNSTTPSPPCLKVKQTNEQPFDWRACVDAFTQTHLERLAQWRGYSIEFCRWLKENGLVGLYKYCIAFPVHERGRNVVAVHYRLKDGSWRYYPQGAKVCPLVIGELIAGDPAHVFESQWDAFAFMDISGERSGIVITRGANNGALITDVMAQDAKVCLWPQNDLPAEKWVKDNCASVKVAVKQAKIPAPHKDLNDWTRAGATSDDLLGAILNAKPIPEQGRTLTGDNSLNSRFLPFAQCDDYPEPLEPGGILWTSWRDR